MREKSIDEKQTEINGMPNGGKKDECLRKLAYDRVDLGDFEGAVKNVTSITDNVMRIEQEVFLIKSASVYEDPEMVTKVRTWIREKRDIKK